MGYMDKFFGADANQSAFNFVVNQLSKIEPGVYRTIYPEYDFAGLVPVDSSGPEWIKSVTFFSMDSVGQARWQSGGADDIPLADVVRAKFEEAIFMAAIGYEYNLEEINTARLIGADLTSDKASAARQAYEMFMFSVAISGSTEKAITGIVNNGSVAIINLTADGTAGATWAGKTPTQILRDINQVLSNIYSTSKTTELADTLLLPIDAWILLGQTPMSATNSETVFSFVQRNNLYTMQTGLPLKIRALRGLEDLGLANVGRMVAYKNDPGVLKLHLPMPHRFLPVWQNGPMRYAVPGIFRTGGVEVRRPVAMRYGDGLVA
jgi:hypothetical protein